jgi:hypothetical protein
VSCTRSKPKSSPTEGEASGLKQTPRGVTGKLVEEIFRDSAPRPISQLEIIRAAETRDGTKLAYTTLRRMIDQLATAGKVEQIPGTKTWMYHQFEKALRDAYAQGWADCFAALQGALEAVRAPSSLSSHAPGHGLADAMPKGGMSMGDTIQNTQASIETLQRFIKAKNQSLLKKYGYGDDVPGQPPPSSPSTPGPTGTTPEWQSAPLAQ